MTKHLLADEGFPKDPIQLAETSKIIESNVRIIDNTRAIKIAGPNVEPMGKVYAKPSLAKPKVARAKISTVKCRLEKVMQKLYDLEPEPACIPEKPLNMDLGVDLYQMEDY